jgi:hypothetical protein
MSGKIEGYDLILLGERYPLSIPIASVAGPSMYEYKSGGFSRAIYFVRDGNSIERRYGLRGFLAAAGNHEQGGDHDTPFFHASLKGAIHCIDRSGNLSILAEGSNYYFK